MSSRENQQVARHALEEAFFRDVDEMICKRLKSEASSQQARESLMQSTGVHDRVLLDELTRLGVTSEGLIAMRLVPMVMVAWAEQSVDEAERQRVLDEARKIGVVEGSVAEALLEHWLNEKPSMTILDAWKRYMTVEFAKISPPARMKLIELIEAQMQAVAKASGGKLGIGTVSKQERELIELMTHAIPR